MRKYYCAILFSLLMLSCSEEYTTDIPSGHSDEMLFRLHTTGYAGEETRSTDALVVFDRLEHYIVNKDDGGFAGNFRSLYKADLAQIKVEGLADGNYYLLVLAVKGDPDKDGAVLHKLENSSSPWLSLGSGSQAKSLQAEYFYVRHPFTVSGGQVQDSDVRLRRIVGKVEFRLNYQSDYVRRSIESADAAPTSDSTFGNVLNADGTVSGEQSMGDWSLLDERQILLLPSGEGGNLRGDIVLHSRRHTGEVIERTYQFDVPVRPGEHSVINISITHPDNNTGLLYIKEKDYTPDNFYTILSDTESKTVYYDSKQRSFNVNEPLQFSIRNDTSLHLRFYSPLAISGVTVYAKTPEMREYFELGYFTQIPAFADAIFPLPLSRREAVYRTESGQYVSIPALNGTDIQTLKFKIVSDDPYWQKISKIEAKWFITFNPYGGDPDQPNGAPNGNWMGMRPVHAREIIALLTNIAYMCSLDDFRARVLSYQDKIVDNDGKTYVDMSIIVDKLQNLARFNTGLVYSGNGVMGLGGGATLGVYQGAYLLHYVNQYQCSFFFHELGHCMGYNHSSGMTYGPWSSECASGYYVGNIHNFPVYSADILNSSANPNIYK